MSHAGGHHAPETAAEIARAVRAGKLRAAEVVERSLARIDALNPAVNALVQVDAERARRRAAEIDAAVARGQDPGPLAGVPAAVKDNLCTDWGFTTCGSEMLRSYRSPFTATAVERLEAAGAVVVGKANLDEFGMGSSTERSCFGPTRHPLDPTRVPGGSSGGSAAAVACGMAAVALGSDTGGSIRQPASFCGLVGVKPTYGRVSRWGLVAYASSLDQVGPLTRTVEDAALVLGVIAGADDRDGTCANLPAEDFTAELDRAPADLVVGVARPGRGTGAGESPGVALALERAAERLRQRGARIVDVDLPHAGAAIAAYYVIATAEASSNLARFDGVRYGRRAELTPGQGLAELYDRSRAEGFGPEVRTRIMLGTHVLSSGYYDAYYLTALRARRRIKQDYDAAFARGCACVLMPATPGPAFRAGEKTADPIAMYLEDAYTVGVNLAGLPGLVVPGGTEEVGGVELPVGVQLVGPALGERALLRVGAVLTSR
ncbi:MAG: Asp-tRNA(Asn)/Glu-tRNA(Gln) amidotransferase subunit GatA [Phycisphaerae bacterium]|nr:Asp-tRNA(Asn)/Glu-tRNA(Gln) amidotransferase subunit GatA [Phycisphaerae bacterium]